MITSYREGLRAIGEPGADGYPSWSSGFNVPQTSLRQTLRLMEPPSLSAGTFVSESYHDSGFSEECQGVTCDGTYWYFSSNSWSSGRERVISKFTLDMRPVSTHTISGDYASHIGDLDYYQGYLYIPLEGPIGLLVLSADLSQRPQHLWLQGQTSASPPQSDCPWCAINPLDGLLYSSNFGNVDQIFGYDPKQSFRHVRTLKLSTTTQRVQGGCFSSEGKLYLSSDESKDIRAFSVLNGIFLGSRALSMENRDADEVEGLCVAKVSLASGPSQLHVILLDNVVDPADDNIYFQHYACPMPSSI